MRIDTSHIFTINSLGEFEKQTLKIFRYQAVYNEVYKEYLSHLKINPDSVTTINNIPFLPVSFFKTRIVSAIPDKSELIFTSSGTSGQDSSKHYVHSAELYRQSFLNGFQKVYGNIQDYCILALLPSYLERSDSSLVYMVKELIKQSGCSDSGFFLKNDGALMSVIEKLNGTSQKVILLGVSFALLDLAEKHPLKLSDNFILMETGGMKGRKKEITREELYNVLCEKFGVKEIHSEYGMTELLSQAYSKGNGIYHCPPWMKIIIRDIYDPFDFVENEKAGGINVIDLANCYSCSFIETQDIGKLHSDDSFEVLGRIEGSQLRGCNLLVE